MNDISRLMSGSDLSCSIPMKTDHCNVRDGRRVGDGSRVGEGENGRWGEMGGECVKWEEDGVRYNGGSQFQRG